MIRKERKALWTYTCERCRVHRRSVDYFGAIEHQQRHERSLQHVGKAVELGMNAFVKALEPTVAAWVAAFEGIGAITDILARTIVDAQRPARQPPKPAGKIRGARPSAVIFDEAQRFNRHRGRTRR